MNQRADSRKKNLQLIVVRPLINRQPWLLSHTMRCNRGEKSNPERVLMESLRAFCALTFDPLTFDPAEHPRQRLLQHRHILREQKESEREHP